VGAGLADGTIPGSLIVGRPRLPEIPDQVRRKVSALNQAPRFDGVRVLAGSLQVTDSAMVSDSRMARCPPPQDRSPKGKDPPEDAGSAGHLGWTPRLGGAEEPSGSAPFHLDERTPGGVAGNPELPQVDV
jgi:hypothetical protein